MAAETVKDKARRCGQIIDVLKKTYPEAHCELNFTNPLELLIATILSAQCNDKQVNIVTEPLFRKYRTAADYAAADPETFASEIKRIGLYRNKAKNIQACCQRLLDLHQGEVPRVMEELTALGGQRRSWKCIPHKPRDRGGYPRGKVGCSAGANVANPSREGGKRSGSVGSTARLDAFQSLDHLARSTLLYGSQPPLRGLRACCFMSAQGVGKNQGLMPDRIRSEI